MKNLFLAVLLFGTSFTYAGTNKVSKTSISINKITVECRFNQCQATAKSTGRQCLHCVSNSGDKFCYQHK